MDVRSTKRWKLIQVAAWTYVVVIGGATAYGNNIYPHGPAIHTGEYVCRNDDRGPCGEATIENSRRLNVPAWVKLARANESGVFLSLIAVALLAVYAGDRHKKQVAGDGDNPGP